MIEQILEQVRALMSESAHPAMLCSFGKDSMLLLSILRKVRKDFPLIWLRTDRNSQQMEFAKRIINDWDLHVFSFPPADVYAVPGSMIYEYAFGAQRFPVVVDIEKGTKCSLNLDSLRLPRVSHIWDVLFIGVKDSDYHPLLGYGKEFFPANGYQLGNAKVYAPLREMTDDQVWQSIRELNVPVDEQRYAGDDSRDDGTLGLCTKCFTAQPQVFCPSAQSMIPGKFRLEAA